MNSALATTYGQWSGPSDTNDTTFHIVIAGSNGESKPLQISLYLTDNFLGYYKNSAAPPVSGYNRPTEFGDAIKAPLLNGTNTYMGAKLFSSNTQAGQFDPPTCADACTTQTACNQKHANVDGSFQSGEFFNIYGLVREECPARNILFGKFPTHLTCVRQVKTHLDDLMGRTLVSCPDS